MFANRESLPFDRGPVGRLQGLVRAEVEPPAPVQPVARVDRPVKVGPSPGAQDLRPGRHEEHRRSCGVRRLRELEHTGRRGAPQTGALGGLQRRACRGRARPRSEPPTRRATGWRGRRLLRRSRPGPQRSTARTAEERAPGRPARSVARVVSGPWTSPPPARSPARNRGRRNPRSHAYRHRGDDCSPTKSTHVSAAPLAAPLSGELGRMPPGIAAARLARPRNVLTRNSAGPGNDGGTPRERDVIPARPPPPLGASPAYRRHPGAGLG